MPSRAPQPALRSDCALHTDLVFEGTLPLKHEDTPPRPTFGSALGRRRRRRAADRAARPGGAIVRTSMIFRFRPGERAGRLDCCAPVAAGVSRVQAATPTRFDCPIWLKLAHVLLERRSQTQRPAARPRAEPLSRYDLGCACWSGRLRIPGRIARPVASSARASRPAASGGPGCSALSAPLQQAALKLHARLAVAGRGRAPLACRRGAAS